MAVINIPFTLRLSTAVQILPAVHTPHTSRSSAVPVLARSLLRFLRSRGKALQGNGLPVCGAGKSNNEDKTYGVRNDRLISCEVDINMTSSKFGLMAVKLQDILRHHSTSPHLTRSEGKPRLEDILRQVIHTSRVQAEHSKCKRSSSASSSSPSLSPRC